jgi:signal peptidase I
MDDTLIDNELVIVNKIVYRVSDIKRFDIVVVNNRQDGDKIIKRVIGLPKEKVKYEDNKLYINDKLIETNLTFKDTADFEVELKENEYFVMGDNRPVSKDSRILGAFPKKDIVGRVSIRLFPFKKIGKIDKKK